MWSGPSRRRGDAAAGRTATTLDAAEPLDIPRELNGGPCRSFRCEAFITAHAELAHVRTRATSPGQNGSHERGFGALKHERRSTDDIDDAVMLAERAEDYRVHLGLADSKGPAFQAANFLIRDSHAAQC
ncbi:hypothetical protein BA062_32020 [Prauserella flavalba]|uniref:Uncharacterized protein n=1 Tax=Prauserella flavalba TaxID=1477506 RepID=A0A318LC48_9PSEU|nr:hypothetical protein BA062_32020 [Prauserella flavalba]